MDLVLGGDFWKYISANEYLHERIKNWLIRVIDFHDRFHGNVTSRCFYTGHFAIFSLAETSYDCF